MSGKDLTKFKRKALKYLFTDGSLYRRTYSTTYPLLVIDAREDQLTIISSAYRQEATYRGRKATYRIVADRFQQGTVYKDVANLVAAYYECQLRSYRRKEEPLYPIYTATLQRKVGINVVYMPPTYSKCYLIVSRNDLLKQLEAIVISYANTRAVVKFIYYDFICRYGVPEQFTIDSGPEN